MPSHYTLTTYSPEWPKEFKCEAERLRVLLCDEIIAIHHISSTSVPGLDAKPIIDLLPLVQDIRRINLYTDRMLNVGYKVWGEYGLPSRCYFTKDAGELHTHNIHIYAANDPEVTRHLAFCAYLCAHSDAQQEYVAVKRVAYSLHPVDIDSYNDSKNAWIKITEHIALSWYQAQSKL